MKESELDLQAEFGPPMIVLFLLKNALIATPNE
jgi:hypothetical protein